MALAYDRWTEEDDKQRNCMPDGDYPALIDGIVSKLTAAGRFDKNGDPIPQRKMLELDLIIMDISGRERKMKDWVMLEGEMSWKFRHLCVAVGLQEAYESDTVEIHQLMKKCPIAKIKSRMMKNKDGVEEKRNTVADYVASAPKATNGADFVDDDIPI